jgi:hypothetical protein
MAVARWNTVKRHLGWCVAACALLMGGRPAGAASALVGASSATELRFAYAETAEWTTMWTSFRLAGDAGPLGVVVPLPDGAFVDHSSDAWFEALEVATAPRVLPPDGLSPYCPGASGPDNPFEISAKVTHEESLLPETIALADDAQGVAAWASAQGLAVDAELSNKLAGTGAVKFVVIRFDTPGGAVSTPTLRISAPKGLPVVPFSITRAGASDLRVTAWLFGEGRGSFTGTTPALVPGNAIAWNAKTGKSNYVAYRDELLAGDADRDLIESTSHDALIEATPFANGAASIDAVVTTYFARASMYGNALPDAAACIDAAKATLDADQAVGPACPRGDLAALAGPCTAAPPGAGELDAAALFCGPGADDLALVAAGAVPSDTWVTRRTFVIAAGMSGKDRGVFNAASPEKLPLVPAAAVDIGDCFGGSGGGATSSSGSGTTTGSTTSSSSGSGGASSGSGSGSTGNGGPGSTGAGNSGNYGGYAGEDLGSDVYIDTSGCACGAPIDTYETVDSGSGDDCDSGSSSSSSSGDDCDSGSSSSSGDDCDSGSSSGSSDDCSADSSSSDSDCSVGQGASRARRRSGPKLSVMALSIVALLLPLRRRGTRKRRGRG